MKFENIRDLVKGVPFIHPDNAKYLYNLIVRERLTRILELGVAHGTATCYMAAALGELNTGKITSVDLVESDVWFKPTPEEQLAKAGLTRFAEIVRMQSGYTWFLHDEIKRLTRDNVCVPEYDLCVIDGPKNWTIDGCAFFLVEKILREGGWVIFDDYNWTYAAADKKRETTDGITHRKLSDAERETPQVRDIFELLVKPHPHYSEFHVFPDSDWAAAKKGRATSKKKCTVHYAEARPSALVNALSRLKQQVLRKFSSS